MRGADLAVKEVYQRYDWRTDTGSDYLALEARRRAIATTARLHASGLARWADGLRFAGRRLARELLLLENLPSAARSSRKSPRCAFISRTGRGSTQKR